MRGRVVLEMIFPFRGEKGGPLGRNHPEQADACGRGASKENLAASAAHLIFLHRMPKRGILE